MKMYRSNRSIWIALCSLLLLTAAAALIGVWILQTANSGLEGWTPVNAQMRQALDQAEKGQSPAGRKAKGTGKASPGKSNPAGADNQASKGKNTGGGTKPADSSSPGPSANSPDPSRRLININTANAARLDALPGIGPAKARAIVDYRRKIGGFHSVKQLLDVKGIGPKTYAKLKNLVTLGS